MTGNTFPQVFLYFFQNTLVRIGFQRVYVITVNQARYGDDGYMTRLHFIILGKSRRGPCLEFCMIETFGFMYLRKSFQYQVFIIPDGDGSRFMPESFAYP